MSNQKRTTTRGTMLDLWRPPQGAGDPIGCLATTYTFDPGLFDEQCLARFLQIGSEPDREELAFLLERENRLGGIYAGVLVDHTQAGVEHSLRWDVLPVTVSGAKQHAKLSLLVWSRHVRIIVASANLTNPGYRTNQEVAAAVDLRPQENDDALLAEATGFLRILLRLVPGASTGPPEVRRAEKFLSMAERQVRRWGTSRPRVKGVRQQLVFTVPGRGPGQAARSSLEEAVQACRRRGESPNQAWIASPFFDLEDETNAVTAALCKSMARGRTRSLRVCVPASLDPEASAVPRLLAPKSLVQTPRKHHASVTVEALPHDDGDGNPRPWHAKMLALRAAGYSALMIGSSNYTAAGMGIGPHPNAEANLLTLVDRVAFSRDIGQLEAMWPETEQVEEPDRAEWLGARSENDEEQLSQAPPVPAGFLSATYRAGVTRWIILRLDPTELPPDWRVHGCGRQEREILCASGWEERGRPALAGLPWEPVEPPDRLLVVWNGQEAFMPLNVEDSRTLPPPAQVEGMSADDLLRILAATDRSAAFRAWTRRQDPANDFDPDLDSATPIDLDPLRRYDLQATFLHRVRHRARVLAQLRANLERPIWSLQALEWRLRGMIGIEPLANRLTRELLAKDGGGDEELLTLADLLVVLAEVQYSPVDGSLPKREFDKAFRPFLAGLAMRLNQAVQASRPRASQDAFGFWERVVKRCQA